jgi:UDPglucose--hexose-1-phosphate uridylyltransferase
VLSGAEGGLDGAGLEGPEPLPGANPARDLFWSAPAYGITEVIEHAAQPVRALVDLDADATAVAVERWRERMRAHPKAAYVHVSVDEGAGTSRAELYALPFVPAAMARERERFGAYATRTMGGNLLADLVQEEVRKRERIVAIDEDTVLMAPFGSRAAYQLLIAPRRPRMRFEDDGPTGGSMLHDALTRLTRRLGDNPVLSLWVRTAPRGAEHFCWRIDIVPRPTGPAGLERGTGLPVNVIPPEQAAAELRKV